MSVGGNHSRLWHDANSGVDDAKRDLEAAVREYSDDPSKKYKIDDAKAKVASAKRAFDSIDRDSDLAYD